MEEVKNQKRNRQNVDCCFLEDQNAMLPGDIEEISAKKSREDAEVKFSEGVKFSIENFVNEDSTTMQSSKSNEDDYDDDDYDDFDDPEDHANLSDNEDFLEDFEDDVSVTSASTTVSTGN